MATYEIKSPEGETFEITAPDGASEQEVMQYAQSEFNKGKGELSAGNVARQFAQGLTFSFGDEIEAASAYLTDEDYGDALKRIRGENKAFQQKNPGIAIGAQVAGAIPSMFVPGAALGQAARASRALALASKSAGARGVANAATRGHAIANAGARALNPAAATTGGVANMAAQGAKQGSVAGAITGFGAGEGDVTNRAAGAAGGAAMGGLVGGVATPVLGTAANALRAGYRAATDTGGKSASRRLAQVLDESGTDAETVIRGALPKVSGTQRTDEHTRALASHWAKGTKPADIELTYTSGAHKGKRISAERIRNQFKEWDGAAAGGRTIPDIMAETPGVSSEPAERAAENAFTRAGGGAAKAAQRFGDRQAGHADRVVDDIGNITGATDRTALRRLAEMRDDMRDLFNPQYDALRANPAKVTGRGKTAKIVKALRESPRFAAIEKEARRDLAELEAQGLLKNTGAADNGVFGFDLVNTIQQRLNSRANPTAVSSPADRDGAMVHKALRDHFNDTFDKAYPGFSSVRANYAAEKRVIEAAEAGDGILFGTGKGRAGMAADDVMQRINSGTASADEILAARELGGTEMLRRAGARPGEGANRAKQFLSPNVQKKLTELYGPKDAEKLIKRLQTESDRLERVRKITGGSPTARRMAGMADEAADAEIAGGALTGNPIAMWNGLANWVSRNIARGNADEVADLFSRMDEKEVIRILEAAGKLAPGLKRADARTARYAGGAAQGLARAMARRAAEDVSGGSSQ